MNKSQAKFKLGTADTLLLAVGTLAVDYICTSKTEIFEVQPGGKKIYLTREALEEKATQYGIHKGKVFPGSSLGNFIQQVQQISFAEPSYAAVHLMTTLAMKDPSTKLLLESLDSKGIKYNITNFDDEDASNPISFLVEANGYTKILSFKDTRMPAIEVKTPKEGTPGLVVIGVAGGNNAQSKLNGFEYAQKHNLPIAVMTTVSEVNQFLKNKELQATFNKIVSHAAFLAINEDEAKKILVAENKEFKRAYDRINLVQQLRAAYKNDNLTILLTFGAEGSLILSGDTIIVQKVPKIPHNEIVSTSGAGDTLTGAFVEGVRMKGMDIEGICWALPRASVASQLALKYTDTRTGQITAEHFLKEPSPEYELEIIKL